MGAAEVTGRRLHLDFALAYAQRGWPVFRLAAGTNVPIARSHGHLDATTDALAITEWWTESPSANIGISPGPAGLIILDVDPRNGGDESFLDLCQRHGRDWLQTWTVLSPRGGQHYYFAAPVGSEVRGRNAVWPGIDAKAHGGYAAAPPSSRKEGVYEWEVGCDPDSIAALPAPTWLLEELMGKPSASRSAAPVVATIPVRERNNTLTSIAGTMRRRGLGREAILAALVVVNRDQCAQPLADDEVERIATSVASYAPAPTARKEVQSINDSGARNEVAPEVIRRTLDRKGTDLGNAERLVERFGDQLRYTPSLGWLVWDGRRWIPDLGGAERAAKATAESIWSEIPLLDDPDAKKARAAHALRSESARSIQAMLTLARSDNEVQIRVDSLDANPWAFNVLNGTLDLRTNDLLPHDPTDLITKLSMVEYDPVATCPNFDAFLIRITRGHPQLRPYLQRAVGYALTAMTWEHVLFVLWGTGSNGKSTFLEAVRHVLGEYARNVEPETLQRAKRSAGGPSEDIARLAGVRLITAAETDDGVQIAEALIKRMTGGDKVTARVPYGRSSFEFTPYGKIFLATNHRPYIRGQDHGTWRRVHLVPFTETIGDDEMDKRLPEKLREEASGILNWALAGLTDYQTRGDLGQPEAVRHATQQYRAEMDLLRRFIESQCRRGRGLELKSSEFYEAFAAWCKVETERPLAQRIVSQRLEDEFGVRRESRRDANYLVGLGFLGQDESGVELVEDVETDSGTFPEEGTIEEVSGSASTCSTSSTGNSLPGPCSCCGGFDWLMEEAGWQCEKCSASPDAGGPR